MHDIEKQYNQALDYLYSFVGYSLKHSSELAKADFNLDRMFELMESLGGPQVFLKMAGDINLLPRILESAHRYVSRPSDEQMQALSRRLQMEPLFE